MKSPPAISRRFVWLYVRAIRGDGRGRNERKTVLVDKTTILGTIDRRSDMPSKKKLMGEVSILIDEKLNNTFGDYTSLGVTIGLKFPADVENFEKEIDRFSKRADDKIKSIMNGISSASGTGPCWK